MWLKNHIIVRQSKEQLTFTQLGNLLGCLPMKKSKKVLLIIFLVLLLLFIAG